MGDAMDEKDLQRLIEGLQAGTLDVRLNVEEAHSSGTYRVAVQLAGERAGRIARGECVAYVHRSRDEDDGDHSEELGATREQVSLLLRAGARWVGSSIYSPVHMG